MIFPLAREDKTVKNGEDTHIPTPVQWYVYPSASATIFHLCMLFHPCPKPSWVDSLTKCRVQFLRMYLKKKTIICSLVSRNFYYCVADEALVFIVFLVTRDTHITTHVYGNKHITAIHISRRPWHRHDVRCVWTTSASPGQCCSYHTGWDSFSCLNLSTVSTYFTGNQFAAFYRNAIILS